MGLRNQIWASASLCIVSINIGILLTWPSSTIILFGSENTTLSRIMTEAELSLFGSLPSFGSLIATPFTGYLLNKIGRKYLTITFVLMQAITWTIRVSFKNVEMILFSSVLAGIGGCGNFVVVVFISEFCQESIRGTLSATPISTAAMGMVLSYWMGGTLDYNTLNCISLSIVIFAAVMISFLKESPTHLMTKGQEEVAAKSMAFYRNVRSDSKVVTQELDAIRRSLSLDMNENPEKEKLNPESITGQKLTTWQFIKNSRSTRRAFGICFILALLSVFQGLIIIQTYAVQLFKEAVPTISSTLTTSLLGVVTCVAALLSGYLTDVAGRKALMIYGSLVEGIFCLLLALQLQINWGPVWLVPVLIYLYSAAFTVGAGTIPYVLIGELFLPEIKGLASMLIVETLWIASFIVLYVFNPLVKLIGLPPVFYIFTAVCFATATISFFMLPETKGLSIEAIQLLFNKSKSVKRQNDL